MKWFLVTRLRVLSVGLTMLLLAGCLAPERVRRDNATNPLLRQRIVDGPWLLEGKMALSDGSSSGSGRLRWEKAADSVQVELIAPLGQGNWQLIENTDGAQLRSSINGESRGNPVELLQREIGWPVPWRALPYWLFGQAYQPAAAAFREAGAVRHLQENGWDITYSRYRNTALGLLPHKITARKTPYMVKIFVQRWTFPGVGDGSF